jgi:integrase/recombinase XerD
MDTLSTTNSDSIQSDTLPSLFQLIDQHLQYLRVLNYSPHTIAGRDIYLNQFGSWAAAKGVTHSHELSRPVLEGFRSHLAAQLKKCGSLLAPQTQRVRLVPVRTFCVWLVRQGHIAHNPAAELEMPRSAVHLPKFILTPQETELVLAGLDTSSPIGLRDRAILEVFYSTGIRRLELIGLKLEDLDRERGFLMVRQGKGKKDRLIPIGKRAIEWIARYLTSARPRWVHEEGQHTLFVTQRGGPISSKHLTAHTARHVSRAALGKTGSCHLFRHTMATAMLDNDADIRCVQEMLGHASLQTTQIYTRVSLKRLKEVHTRTHPARSG